MVSNFGINIRRQYTLPVSQETILQRFRRYAGTKSALFHIHAGNDKVFLKIKDDESKWWSPELSLTVESEGDGALVREVAGPNPSTFTMTIFLLTVGSTLLFLSLMVALSQLSLGLSYLWSLGIAGLAALFIMITYYVIWRGRKKAEGQILLLRKCVRQIIDEK